MVKKIDDIIGKVCGFISIFSIASFVGIILIITIDVAWRKLFSGGILGSYEIVERLLLILVFGTFAYAQVKKGHIHVTLFIAKFPRVFRMVLFGVLGLLSAGTAMYCGYSTITQAMMTKIPTAVLRIPLSPFFYIAAVCMFVFAAVLLWDAIKCFVALKDNDIREEIESAWN